MRLVDADLILLCLIMEGQNNPTKYGLKLGDTIRFSPSEVDAIVRKIPTIEERKTGQWIPCSERLPETSGMYIVDDCKFGAHWIHTAEYVQGTGLWCEQVFMHAYSGQEQIVAWMPLPEPYQGKRKGEE